MTTIAAASHADTETAPHGWRWAPAWVLAFVALWPAPGIAEGVMVLGALAAILRLLLMRFRGGTRLLSGPAWALTSVLFFAYWLPQLISSFDAMDRARAFQESLVDLRYLPFLWLALGLVLLRQPDTTALLALLPCLWGGRCLWTRRRHRHHTPGLAMQLRRGSGHRRGQRILR